MRRTQVVLELAQIVIPLVGPIQPSVIGDSFVFIERDPVLHQRYLFAASLLGEHVLNCWFAKYISQVTGLVTSGRKLRTSSRLVKSGRYSELVADGIRR